MDNKYNGPVVLRPDLIHEETGRRCVELTEVTSELKAALRHISEQLLDGNPEEYGGIDHMHADLAQFAHLAAEGMATVKDKSQMTEMVHGELALAERDQARKELAEWKRLHAQPIADPPEATDKYVDVMGEMTISFTVQLPVELCREPIACDDPAIEAALQAVSGHICTYIWGEDKKPAVVYCDVGEQNVEIESDDRKCLTDEPVNSGSCNDSDLAPKRERS